MDFAGESDFGGHFRGSGGEDGGGELVAGLVDEGAGEVLAVAYDYAFGETGLDGGLVGSFGSSEGELLDAQVFAVAAVGVRVEVAEGGAFEDGAGAGAGWEIVGFREGEDELADGAGLGEADGGSGGGAHGVDGGFGLLAQAYDEQAVGGQASGSVEQHGLVGGGLELSAGEDGGGGGLDRFVGGQQGRDGS